VNVVEWNKAVKLLKQEGFTYAGNCMCAARTEKYRRGPWVIKMSKTSGFATLTVRNMTLKTKKITDVENLIQTIQEAPKIY
jgi:hypothetical protein